MAVFFCDSFYHQYNSNDLEMKWDYIKSPGNIFFTSDTRVRITGRRCIFISGYAYMQKNFSSKTAINCKFGFKISALPEDSTENFKILKINGNNEDIDVEITNDGRLYISIGELISKTGSGVVSAETWYHLEIICESGNYKLYLNETMLLGNVNPTSTSYTNLKFFGNTGTVIYYADMVLSDDTTQGGDKEVYCLAPNAAGILAQFTPSEALPNYDCVNDIPLDITKYVESGVINNQDRYEFEDLPTGGSIDAVQVCIYAKKDNPGSIKTFLLVAPTTIGYCNPEGIQIVTDSPRYICGVYPTNPDDSLAWEEADINGTEFGFMIGEVS